MGKFFGLMACLGTVAIVGCSGSKEAKESLARIDKTVAESKASVERSKRILTDLTVCHTKEADQKISEAAEANAVTSELVADVQDTKIVNAQCKGKDIILQKKVYEAEGSIVITGPSSATPITSVEVESVRTCAKLESKNIVTDVTQSANKSTLVLEADGDVQLPVSTSSWKLGLAINVAEGKNLLKIKYFNCVEYMEAPGENGGFRRVCAKSNLVSEKEVVLNIAVKQNILEGERTEEGCPKASEKPKTDGQEQ